MQDFFKKQRLQTSIGEHKTKTWPEVQGGKDLQLIDLMSKRAALSTSGEYALRQAFEARSNVF